MKVIILSAVIALGTTSAFAQQFKIEPGATINKDIPRTLLAPAVGMIRAYGWRCDSISSARPFVFSRGFTVICNQFAYTYNFEDRGGNWVVTLD